MDQLKAASDQENARVKIQQIEGNIKILKDSLAALLNDDNISLMEDTFMAMQPNNGTEGSIDYKDLGRYRSAVLNEEKYSKLVEKSNADYYPKVDFNAYYGVNYGPNDKTNPNSGEWNNEEDWHVSINIKWSVFDFGRRNAVKRKATLRKLQSEKNKLATELELKRSLSEAVTQIQLAIDDFNSAEAEQLLTRETERIEQIRFSKGAADMDDLLYAKARNKLALSRSISARYNYQNRRFYLDYILENGENK